MSDKSPKPLFPTFGMASNSSSPQKSNTPKQYAPFFGAVFNALDSHFRMGYAQGISDQSYLTSYHVDDDDNFSFIIATRANQNDSNNNIYQEAMNFSKAIWDISSENELYNVSATANYNSERNEVVFCFTICSSLELMELIENILKPYEMDDTDSPIVRFSNAHKAQGMSFSLFSQYSIKHIKVLLREAQGRTTEGLGLGIHLSH